MTISPLRDSETLRQQKNLTTTQKRANTETREGVLVNNFINNDNVNLEDTCDTLVISKSTRMPSRLYEINNPSEKSIIPISAIAIAVMGTIALLSAFVKRNTRINLKITDEKRVRQGCLTRFILRIRSKIIQRKSGNKIYKVKNM